MQAGHAPHPSPLIIGSPCKICHGRYLSILVITDVNKNRTSCVHARRHARRHARTHRSATDCFSMVLLAGVHEGPYGLCSSSLHVAPVPAPACGISTGARLPRGRIQHAEPESPRVNATTMLRCIDAACGFSRDTRGIVSTGGDDPPRAGKRGNGPTGSLVGQTPS